jgi:predicted DNA-binding protein
MDITTQSFKLPSEHKRALKMIAAEQDTTPSELLREFVEDMIRDYKGGIFFDMAANKNLHNCHASIADAE